MGSYKPGFWPVYIRLEKPGRELIVDAKKLQYPCLLFANVEMLRIEEMELDPYFSEEEEYIFFDTSFDKIGVLVACINQFSLIKKPSKKPVKRILY